MITLNKLSIAGKKYYWLVLVFVGLFLFGLIILQFSSQKKRNAPQPEQISGTYPGNTNNFTLKDGLDIKNEINRAKVYKSSTKELKSKSENISKKLGFTNKAEERADSLKGGSLVYTESGKVLIVYDKQIEYASTNQKPSSTILSEDELRKNALIFIKTLIEPPLPFNETSQGVFVQDISKKVPNQGIYNFSFSYLVENLEVLPAHVKLQMTSGGDILSLSMQELEIGDVVNEVEILNPSEAVDLLKSQKGSLIEISEQVEGLANVSKLDSVEINALSLGYYYPTLSREKNLQPVWVFKGEARVSQSKSQVVFVVPATK